MRNIPIIEKCRLILSGFGIFKSAVAVYAGDHMWRIDSSSSALGGGLEAAAVHIAQANRESTPSAVPKRVGG